MIEWRERKVIKVHGRKVGLLHWTEKAPVGTIYFVELFDLETKTPLAQGKGSSREIALEKAKDLLK